MLTLIIYCLINGNEERKKEGKKERRQERRKRERDFSLGHPFLRK
jgi:hypothetical protein